MPFCTKCGTQANEGAKFCVKCGEKLNVPAPMPAAQPTRTVQPSVPVAKDFSRVTVRYCCPNGHAFDGTEQNGVCPTCGAPLQKGGFIQLYRMGNYMGSMVGMGIYIDDIPFGHIANQQSLRISVPFGPHKVHVTHTTTRKCNDPVFTVSPQAPYVWCKAHFVKAGFAIQIDPASPADMPQV